ncbi:hypothetical protein A4X09_0g5646 [Tilletia walkeri]|uniref:Reverse transcriptase Ty1/copia-type domain-containing protein n=1 Tax=Tilletia walkeri TaxID=117179 RepID=A0A8X7N6R7_9BASI|nr:hypothetical protein A4X09_0g5646 [Tilletia walkeri]
MLSTRPAAMQKSRPSLQVSGHVLELYHSTHSDQRQNLAVVETCYRAYTQLTAKVDKLKAAIDTEKQRMDTQRSQAEERGTQLDTSQRECRHLKTQVDDLEERISGINTVHTQQALYSSISTCTDQSLRIRKLESQLAEKTTFEAEQQRRIVELERQVQRSRFATDKRAHTGRRRTGSLRRPSKHCGEQDITITELSNRERAHLQRIEVLHGRRRSRSISPGAFRSRSESGSLLASPRPTGDVPHLDSPEPFSRWPPTSTGTSTKHQLDVVTAYLYGELHDTIYMKQPPYSEAKGQEHLACRLHCSIYGLKQSDREWFLILRSALLELGFHQSVANQAISIFESGEVAVVVASYVDDALVLERDLADVSAFKAQLAKRFQMKDQGQIGQFQGMKVERSED